MPQVMKDYLVTFDDDGTIESTKDITNPSVPPRKRRIVVKAANLTDAKKAARALYTFST